MGSAYEHLSRERLLALLAAKGEPMHADEASPGPSAPPSSGDRYRQVVEEAVDGIFMFDDEAVYLDVNEVGARMLGMTREEVIGKRIHDFVIDAEHEALKQLRARVGAGEWVLHEWQIQRKDGSTFTAEVSAKLLPDGRYQGIWRDVTERREREQALQLSEQRFRALTAASFEGISITERGVVVDVNDQMARLLGYDRSELLGKEVAQMVAPELREAVNVGSNAGSSFAFGRAPHARIVTVREAR